MVIKFHLPFFDIHSFWIDDNRLLLFDNKKPLIPRIYFCLIILFRGSFFPRLISFYHLLFMLWKMSPYIVELSPNLSILTIEKTHIPNVYQFALISVCSVSSVDKIRVFHQNKRRKHTKNHFKQYVRTRAMS